MIRLLISLVTAGAVISCSMENTETSGALTVDPNSDTPVPDWITAEYLDLNKDNIINVLDLVIMSKFFGQTVSEPEEDDPAVVTDYRFCSGDSGGGEGEATLEGFGPVTDNSAFRKRFDSPNGGSYVYALLDTGPESISHGFRNVCFAVRLWVAEDLIPKEITLKAVTPTIQSSRPSYGTIPLPDTLTVPLHLKSVVFMLKPDRKGKYVYPLKWDYKSDKGSLVASTSVEGNKFYQWIRVEEQESYESEHLSPSRTPASVYLRKTAELLPKVNESGEYWKWDTTRLTDEELTKITAEEIPISEDLTVSTISLSLLLKPPTSQFPLSWGLNIPISEETYINMSPDEVRRRYFREDVEETGN